MQEREKASRSYREREVAQKALRHMLFQGLFVSIKFTVQCCQTSSYVSQFSSLNELLESCISTAHTRRNNYTFIKIYDYVLHFPSRLHLH